MTLDSDLAAIRAVARQLRGATRPVDSRRAGALATALDHSARGIARGVDFLKAERDSVPQAVDLGDPEPYRGLDLADAAARLVERALAALGADDVMNRDGVDAGRVGAEVDGFIAAVAASGRRTSPLARGVAALSPGADGPGRARTGAAGTSRAAALLAEPRSGTNRRAVLDAVAAVARTPAVGLTDVEAQRATGLTPNSERPRRVELVDGGWLADSGVTRAHHGREHTVWVLTDKAARLAAGLPVVA